MHSHLPGTISPIHWCHTEHIRVCEGSKCPQGSWFPMSLKASHPTSSSNSTALVPSFAQSSVCTRKLGCFARARHLQASPARQTLSLNAFCADFLTLEGKMGRSPLAALPRGADTQRHIRLFPFFATPRCPSPCLFSQIPGRSLQGLLAPQKQNSTQLRVSAWRQELRVAAPCSSHGRSLPPARQTPGSPELRQHPHLLLPSLENCLPTTYLSPYLPLYWNLYPCNHARMS